VVATLADAEHAKFVDYMNQIECGACVTITRKGSVTTVSNKGNLPEGANGRHFFTCSLKDGLLQTWGYDKLFTLTDEVA
jgi:putative heme iron utilization protein